MTPLSAGIVAKIRALRKLEGVSAKELADLITLQGFPFTRSMVAMAEGGYRNTIPVDYLLLAATALGTDAATLLSGPVTCPTCQGQAPAGFTCNTCGGAR